MDDPGFTIQDVSAYLCSQVEVRRVLLRRVRQSRRTEIVSEIAVLEKARVDIFGPTGLHQDHRS